MNRLEEELLRTEAGDAKPLLSVCSGTRVDAGRWWRRTPIWLCVVDGGLIMLAVARRRYVKRATFEECRATHYCHATGELVVAPCEGLAFRRFAMSPGEALRLMKALGVGGRRLAGSGQSDAHATASDPKETQRTKEKV